MILWSIGALGLAACSGGPPPAATGDGSRGQPAAASWSAETGPALPEPIANNAVAAASLEGRPFVFTFLGLGQAKGFQAITTHAYRLDVARGLWERLPDVPGAVGRLAATAQVVADRVYIFGGYAVAPDGKETTSAAVDIYDIRANRYARGADAPTPVDDSVSGVWRGRLIYLVGGWSMSDNVRLVQVYDPERNTWQQASPIIGTPVFGHAGGIVGDTIVYCDGAKVQAPKTPKYTLTAECYRGDIDPGDPTRIGWRRVASPPGPARYRMAAGPVDTQGVRGVLFAGGTDNAYNYDGVGYDGRPSEPLGTSWIYDVEDDSWTQGPRLTVSTMDHRGLVRVDEPDPGASARSATSDRSSWWIVGGFGTHQSVTAHVARLRPPR